MYHVELRKFPHVAYLYNQSERQVSAMLVMWVNGEWFEEGEQKWNSNEATIKVLEGPELSLPELSLGRGWRNAERHGEDVTERVLTAVRQQLQPAGAAVAGGSGPASPADGEGRPAEGAAAAGSAQGANADSQLLADSLALELLALLDVEPVALSRTWGLAAERLGDASSAESLALAELAVRSLVGRGLAVLRESGLPGADGDGPGAATAWQVVTDDRVDVALRAGESWGAGERGALQIARKT
jgi:hypothetical protein